MNTSFWAQITISEDQDLPAEGLDEATVNSVCEEIEGKVARVTRVSPADPETYVGE